jgi:hypothetical protein
VQNEGIYAINRVPYFLRDLTVLTIGFLSWERYKGGWNLHSDTYKKRQMSNPRNCQQKQKALAYFRAQIHLVGEPQTCSLCI